MSQNPPSLRTRYFTTTVVLGLIALVVVSFFYRDAVVTKNSVTTTYEIIQNKKKSLDKIRLNLLKVYLNIDLFLLDPLSKGNPDAINDLIVDSAGHAESIATPARITQTDYSHQSKLLNNHFQQLQRQIEDLEQARLDITRQYPGLAVSAIEMPISQNSVISGLQILIDEIESGDLQPESEQLYPLLLKTYSLWISEISQMRIYLANRLASFSEQILKSQGNSVRELKDQVDTNISLIEELYQQEDSFEASSVIKDIKHHTSRWYDVFLDVREISESGAWRSDTHMLQTRIIPLIESIISILNQTNDFLEQDHSRLSEKLKNNNENLSILVVSIILAFTIFIAGIIYSLDKIVFGPISNVTRALLSKAHDFNQPRLEFSNSKEIGNLIRAFQRMDDEVTQRQKDLEHQAMHDHLTGLPNRFMLNQRIEYQILSSERDNNNFSLLLMDLDHFKDINDTLGHDAGDILLNEVSKRIQDLLRKSDTFARLGGDEFCILLPGTERNNSDLIAREIIETIRQPFPIYSHNVNIGASIGIASYPQDGSDPSTLLQRADTAMYVAKRKRTGISFYEAEEDIHSIERLSLINDLTEAVESKHIYLSYQPRFDAKNMSITGAEALLRWEHQKFGFVSPDKVIELAEHTGIINQLTLLVLDIAIAQCALWHSQGHLISVSVNLSAQDLYNGSLCDQISNLLEQHALESKYLTLEITESAMMENIGKSLETLNLLGDLGVTLSVDDFGTGFSSLSYLKKLPVNELKIDKSFVLGMLENHNDRVIVQSTINMGHELGLIVVAEGIENMITMNRISDMGCDYFQGYFMGEPDSSDNLLVLVDKHASPGTHDKTRIG